jgi:UDP-N-acetylmuramoylalanine--D-glutamate ligase
MEANLRNKNIIIVGAGITGLSLVPFLKDKTKNLYLFDENLTNDPQLEQVFFTNRLESLPESIDLLIKSPGIKPTHAIFKKYNAPVLSEIEIARNYFKGKIIAITGTDGKSTTTALTYHILKKNYPKTELGGNIGFPFIDFCTRDLEFAVLELSSYQLEDSKFLNMDSTAFLNLAPDHLERHGTLENYREAKKKIINRINPDSEFITNEKLLKSLELEKLNTPTTVKIFGVEENSNARILLKEKKIITQKNIYDTSSFLLQGKHNLENLAASILLLEKYLLPSQIQEGFSDFKGLSYRYELVLEKNSIQFINDSKSTNIHSMLSGISGLDDKEKILFIMGGKDKSEPIQNLIQRIKELDSKVILIGEARTKWRNDFLSELKDQFYEKETLKEALILSKEIYNQFAFTKLIFSPACASFDQYKNFEQRGAEFNSIIKELFSEV